MSGDINALPTGQEKASNARGIPGGGGDVEASIWLIHYMWYEPNTDENNFYL